MFSHNQDMHPGDQMRLRELKIERQWHGPLKGQFLGEAIFDAPTGSVSLNLNGEQCARMFAVIADGIVATAREAATNLTREAMASIAKDATPAIEAKP